MKKMDGKTKNRLFIVMNLVLSFLTMIILLTIMGGILKKDEIYISRFLCISILVYAAYQILLFAVYKEKKDRIRIVVVGIIYIIAAILAYNCDRHYTIYYISTATVVFAMLVNQILKIDKKSQKKGFLITDILTVVICVLLIVAIFTNMTEENAHLIVLVAIFLMLLSTMRRILLPVIRFEKIKLFLSIIIKTHTIDVIIFLLAFIIAFSFLFPLVEESITNFWDGMWYSFAVITTIGFGDFAATSAVGRILTVILGIYGIVVVAIITSAIVNFYNEVSAKEKSKEIVD